jgi:methionyl-tRNA formyltransferase
LKKLKLVFCGTPDFAVPSLEVISRHPLVDLYFVVTMPDRPSGRGQKQGPPPIALYAKNNHLPLLQTSNINKEEHFLNQIKMTNIDCFLVLAFSQFFNEKILQIPRLGCFNIHTSLLPKYRGAAPIQYCLLNGEQETGVCIQKMAKEMDAGDLVMSKTVSIEKQDTYAELYDKLKIEAATCASLLVDNLVTGNINYTPQNHALATFAPSVKKEDGHLLFAEHTSEQILNRIRAFCLWPGTYCFLNKTRLLIHSAVYINRSLAPGQVSISEGIFLVGTNDATLRLTNIQWEGKKSLDDKSWIMGLQNKDIVWKLT